MDEEQKQESSDQSTVETQTESSSSPSVSFPTIPSSSDAKSKKGLILLIISILAILGILGFFIFRGSQQAESTPTPLPTVEGVTSETGAPTATPESLDKSKIKIEIQNGTGISGEAVFLQTQLKNLGYSDIKVGNAATHDATNTTVTYGKNAPQSVMDEITKKLEELYKKVEVKNSTTQTTGVLVVTGLRKGATAKPSATPTPKSTATAKPSPTGTGTATSSPTATATPTATP